MPARACSRRRVALVAGLVAGLVGCGPAAGRPDEPAAGPDRALRVVQLNLCSSGIAGCYTGRATAEAAALIAAERPDLVTLNEVCRDDVTILEGTLRDAAPGAAVTSAFQPALDRRTGRPWRCRNGRDFGVGMVSRRPPVPGSRPAAGIYPAQAADDPEDRAWLCLDVAAAPAPEPAAPAPEPAAPATEPAAPAAEPAAPAPEPAAPAVTACTTHLAYTDREVALVQCRHLFGTVLAGRRGPVVLGADLNLGPGDTPALRSCLPAGAALAGDGGQQRVVATTGYAVAETRTVDLRGSTDHPGLLVTLAARAGVGG